jgi:hypothetical protein
LPEQRAEQVVEDGRVGAQAEARAAGIGREVRRHPVRQRGQHGHAERLGGLDRDALGEDRVGGQRQVRVLLGRAERQHDPVVVLEVHLELHPVEVGDAHDRGAVTGRSARAGAADWLPGKDSNLD